MEKRPEGLDEQAGNRLSDGLLLPIFAVAAVFLFIILCFYAYNNVMKNKDNNEIVELQGDDSGFKVAPTDPGGMEVVHTDKAVFNTVTGQQENTDGSVNVQAEEQAVTAEQLAANSEGGAEEAEEGTSIAVTSDSGSAESGEPIGNDDTTRTVNIAEDETPEAQADTISINAAKLKALNAENKKAAATPKNDVKAEVKKETNKATGESKTIVQFKEAPKSMPAAKISPAAAGGDGSYFVQVSSHSSRSEAEAAWNKIKGKYGAEIGSAASKITEADVKGKKFYRLSFGPFGDRGAASTKCGILKAKGQDCIISKI